jgi:hypothetical protein
MMVSDDDDAGDGVDDGEAKGSCGSMRTERKCCIEMSPMAFKK